MLRPANGYVADFVAHLNPLSVLTAADAMVADAGPGDPARMLAPEAPLRDALPFFAASPRRSGWCRTARRWAGSPRARSIPCSPARLRRRRTTGRSRRTGRRTEAAPADGEGAPRWPVVGTFAAISSGTRPARTHSRYPAAIPATWPTRRAPTLRRQCLKRRYRHGSRFVGAQHGVAAAPVAAAARRPMSDAGSTGARASDERRRRQPTSTTPRAAPRAGRWSSPSTAPAAPRRSSCRWCAS